MTTTANCFSCARHHRIEKGNLKQCLAFQVDPSNCASRDAYEEEITARHATRAKRRAERARKAGGRGKKERKKSCQRKKRKEERKEENVIVMISSDSATFLSHVFTHTHTTLHTQEERRKRNTDRREKERERKFGGWNPPPAACARAYRSQS